MDFTSLSSGTQRVRTCTCCNQVEHEGQHRSCCAVVKGLQRSVFFVAAPGVFCGEELAALEAAAAADAGDAGARGELLRHLHVRTIFKLIHAASCFLHPVEPWLAIPIVVRLRHSARNISRGLRLDQAQKSALYRAPNFS